MTISSILWISTTLIVIIFGIYLLFYCSKMYKKSFKLTDINESIKLLNLNLAGKIGVGSISGIAVSILIGGVGTIFWIWVSAIFLSKIIYLETKAGIKYRKKIGDSYFGGPQVYLDNKRLSLIYTVLIIFMYLFVFILIQSNTIVFSFEMFFKLKKEFIVLILILVIYFSINKGISKISNITSLLVPVMSFIYIIIGIVVIVRNYSIIPALLLKIIKSAFSFKSIVTVPIIIGFQRSIFSNEAGMGTTAMVAALSSDNDYQKECFFQVLGTYFITLVVCTISAFIILTSNIESINIVNSNELGIINYAFNYHFGRVGNLLLLTIVFLFSYSTLITSYYYGLINIKYLFNNKSDAFIKLLVIIVVILSIYISSSNIWLIIDIFTSLTTLINLYALIKLRRELLED